MRVTLSVPSRARRKKLLKLAKGYRWKRSNVFSYAKNAVMKAGLYAYEHRKSKKREFRQLWIARISAALEPMNVNYSTFAHQMTKKMILLNRKVLSNMAIEHPEVFASVVKEALQ